MSQMQSSFDARTRFVVFWIFTEVWFAVLLSFGLAWLVKSDNVEMLRVLGFLSLPAVALSQLPLLRGRVEKPWLWLIAGVGAAVLHEVFIQAILQPATGVLLEKQGSGLETWLPYFLLTSALSGIAIGGAQGVAMARWRAGPGGWFVVVLGASLIAGTISGVIWVVSGVAAAGGDAEAPAAAVLAAALRQVVFGGLTGFYMWSRIGQRSVDAPRPVP
jgi:hypothetical protein